MKIWRLVRRRHAQTAEAAYSGDGAALRGGRWNSRYVRIAYASTSRALALIELLVHIDWSDLPDDLVIVGATLEHPPLPAPPLSIGWDANPPGVASMHIGDAFVREAAAGAMLVPSAVVPGDHNVLINPAHAHFSAIVFDAVEEFVIDARIAQQKG